MKYFWPAKGRFWNNVNAALVTAIPIVVLGAIFGDLSGRGAVTGMLCASIYCFFGCLLGGLRCKADSPTAPMTNYWAGTVMTLGATYAATQEVHFLNLVLLETGILLLLFSVFKLGRFFSLVVGLVISGFLTGIGMLIFRQAWIGLMKADGIFMLNLGLSLLFAALLVVLKMFQNKGKISHKIPCMLLVIVVGSILGKWLVSLGVPLSFLQPEATFHSLADFQNLITQSIPTSIDLSMTIHALWPAFLLALLAYIDTLGTAESMKFKFKFPLNRNHELRGVGVSTIICSFISGIPGAGATQKSYLIAEEGGDSRFAGMLAALVALLIIFYGQDLLGFIPVVVFKGILLKVAYDVVDIRPWKLAFVYWRKKKGDHLDPRALLLIAGTALVSLKDVNLAIILGCGVFYLLRWFSHKWPDRMRPLKDEVLYAPNSRLEGFSDEP